MKICIYIVSLTISIFSQNIKVTNVSKDVIILHPEDYRDINEIRKVGGNVTAVRTDSGIVLFDAFISVEAAKIGKRIIEKYFPDQPIKYLIISHHHADHITGVSVFENVYLIAHHNLKNYTDFKFDLFISSDTLLTLGNKKFEILCFGNAHTNNDIAVLDREDKLLIMGDMLCYQKCYILGNKSDVQNWINLLEILLKRKSEYQFIIPGHGSIVEDYSALIEQQNYLMEIYKTSKKAKDKYLSIEEMLKNITLDKYKHYLLYEKLELDLKICWDLLSN